MKPTHHVLWILPLLILTLLFGTRLWTWNLWRQDYAEAERLAKTVWPMALSLKEFEGENGRTPRDLNELSNYDPTLDLTPLSNYEYTLNSEGIRFRVNVNDRFALIIDERGNPLWEPTAEAGR